MNYDDYVACFNTGNDAELVERFFCDDVAFTGGSRDYRGKAELLNFLDWAHDGVREVIRVQNMLRGDDLIFVDVDMDFHATKHRTDFPFGELHPGDLVTVKFFVTYRLRDGKIAELKSMTWPPEKGVTKLPRLGGHASQRAAFAAYVSAFSNADLERFPTFYTEDVRLDLNMLPPILGDQGIIDFYQPMFARVRESLTIHSLLADDHHIALDATSRFTAIEDAPDFVVGALAKGDAIDVRVFVHYELRDGLIARIRVGRGGAPVFHRSAS